MKALLAIIALPFLIIFRLLIAILAIVLRLLLRLVFGTAESRDTKRIRSITADIKEVLQEDLFGDQSESSQKFRNEVKKQLFAERELLFAKYR